MADSDDLKDRVVEVATKPASVSTEAGAVTNPNVQQVIAADKYIRAAKAADRKSLGIRFAQFIPQGF